MALLNGPGHKLIDIKDLMKFKKIIFILVFLCLSINKSFAQGQNPYFPNKEPEFQMAEKFMKVNLYKKDDVYKVESLEVIMEKFNYLSDYKIWKDNSYNGRLISFRDKDLGYFAVNSLSTIICGDGFDASGNLTGGCEDLPEGNLTVQLPYFPNGKSADIFDPSGKKVLTIDLSSKATCN